MAKPTHFERHAQLGILTVDDDQVNLMVMEQLLKPCGWKIVPAIDGTEALDLLNDETWPDLVFLDYQMEVGDSGDEICRKMRKVFGPKQIPIVMCTAMTAGSLAIDKCLQAGASDYLLKPYDRTKMIEKVEHYVGVEKARRTAAPPPAPAPPAAPPQPSSSSTGAVAPAPPAKAVQPPAPVAPQQHPVEEFCKCLDLEYIGKKLAAAGMTLEQLKQMDDTALRKAGVVVKSQRDKITEALKGL